MSQSVPTPSGGSPVAQTQSLVTEKKWSWAHPADGALPSLPPLTDPVYVARIEFDGMLDIHEAAGKRLRASVRECERWSLYLAGALSQLAELIQDEDRHPDPRPFERFGIADPESLLKEPIRDGHWPLLEKGRDIAQDLAFGRFSLPIKAAGKQLREACRQAEPAEKKMQSLYHDFRRAELLLQRYALRLCRARQASRQRVEAAIADRVDPVSQYEGVIVPFETIVGGKGGRHEGK